MPDSDVELCINDHLIIFLANKDMVSEVEVFFKKTWKFHALATILGIYFVSSMFLRRRMQEDLLPYKLLDRVQHENSFTSRGRKNDEKIEKRIKASTLIWN